MRFRWTRRPLSALMIGMLLVSTSVAAQEGVLGIQMSRAGSGTSWLPDASPMHAVHTTAGAWTFMTHGVAFLQYDNQGGPRGSSQLGSINWGMLMAGRDVAGGRLQLRGMLSLEPWTVGASGYPLLLQTGETYRGAPLVDRQHPHDLFMELAVQYERGITKDLALSLYAAPVGEPAAGPVAFPHRSSAANDPFAPLSHHWQDATHIVFGTLTAGVFTRTFKLEGSVFNGREPDENRTNFDYEGRSLDSYAGRATWNPTARWSLSGAFAYMKSPEGRRPDESGQRMTASALYSRPVATDGSLSLAAVYGANRHPGEHVEPSYLVEGNLDFRGRHSVFGRVEYVRKEAADLVLPATPGFEAANVTEVALGYAYELKRTGPLRIAVGVRGAVNFIPESLADAYGGRAPTGFAVYFRVRPPPMPAAVDHSTHNMR
jgi:hypothetical protein